MALAVAKAAVYMAAALVILVALAVAALETGWGKDWLRQLIVVQSNRYLSATLEIGRLQGSLFRGLQLDDVHLSREGRTLVRIASISLSYSIRELVEGGTVIRRLTIVRPHVVASRLPDGRWDVADLVRRERRENRRTGPGRSIRLDRIEVVDGLVEVRAPLKLGAANVPTRFEALQATLSFGYEPVQWQLDFESASFRGSEPSLTVTRLAGGLGSGQAGWAFTGLHVETPQSTFTLNGRVNREQQPTILDLQVDAPRFPFLEWAGVLGGLRRMAVDSSFTVRLSGPTRALRTTIDLRSNAGDVRGAVTLDTTVPGWHGRGELTIARLDLTRWFSRPEWVSDITGRVRFDLDLDLGRRFPRGSYDFDGAHAAYVGYQADRIRAKGTINATHVLIDSATALAYGAPVSLTSSSLAIDRPFAFRFQGAARGVDLRRLPGSVPVPHVESNLAFEYDITGQFSDGFLTGSASFAPSMFVGAEVGDGATGAIDTSVRPFRYRGEGSIEGVDLGRFGTALDIEWMTDPRYAGTLSGRFHVDGAGADLPSMTLTGGGRLDRAVMFDGTLSNANVFVNIRDGSLDAGFDGRLSGVNPAMVFDDPRYEAMLTGSGRGTVAVRDLLVRSPALPDYTVSAEVELVSSQIRGVAIERGRLRARLADTALDVGEVHVSGPLLDARGAGVLQLGGERSSTFDYTIERADLALFRERFGRAVTGDVLTTGRLTGPTRRLQLEGTAVATHLDVEGLRALNATAEYTVTNPLENPSSMTFRLTTRSSFVELFEVAFERLEAEVNFDRGRLSASVDASRPNGPAGRVELGGTVDIAARYLRVAALQLTFRDSTWVLDPTAPTASMRWDEDGVAVDRILLLGRGDERQRIELAGTWRTDGTGRLRIAASRIFLDAFAAPAGTPARYGGVLDVDATIMGTRARPVVIGELTVNEGRIRRFSYERLTGRVDLAEGALRLDLRMDQSPGVWLTAAGTVPLGVFGRRGSEQPIDVAVRSSPIGLGLIEGVTDVVRNVSGQMRLNVTAVGTSLDPHLNGTIDLTDAAFQVVATGVRYQRGRALIQLSPDRIVVESLHVEDERGNSLEVKGSLGTHELRVGDVEIDAAAKQFGVLRNEYGTIAVNAQLRISGQAESPRILGTITIGDGELNLNAILDRTLLQPYSTVAAPVPAAFADLDAVAALNPWERLGLDVELHVPGTLRLVGDELQVGPGTPLGLGSFNLRVIGDLYLYKDPGDPLYVNGSFDSVRGTYAFQGRRFDIDPISSINFRGDLNPEVFVTVERIISGVEVRVTIAGPLREPELQLASTPPLESSDVLSLILFNTSTSELSAEQQQELVVRAGALAAGFIAAPLMTALERSLGLDVLEIEPPATSNEGVRVTIGDELAPGLVARFSRQFGPNEYDEATIEYFLSRLLRIRATFSDAGSMATRSPFRRVERAGIDLILFFSF
jgi:autotransporter translocation and assembly factor TamB